MLLTSFSHLFPTEQQQYGRDILSHPGPWKGTDPAVPSPSSFSIQGNNALQLEVGWVQVSLPHLASAGAYSSAGR